MIRTKFTKTMAFLLALAMMLTILPVTALADSEEFEVDDTVQTEGPVICTVCGTEDCDKVYAEVGLAEEDDDEDAFNVVIEDIDADDADADDADDVDVDEDVDLDAGLMNIGDYMGFASVNTGIIGNAAFSGNPDNIPVYGYEDAASFEFSGVQEGVTTISLTGSQLPSAAIIGSFITGLNPISGSALRLTPGNRAAVNISVTLDFENATIASGATARAATVENVIFTFSPTAATQFSEATAVIGASFLPGVLDFRIDGGRLKTNEDLTTVGTGAGVNIKIGAPGNRFEIRYEQVCEVNYETEMLKAVASTGVMWAVVPNNFTIPAANQFNFLAAGKEVSLKNAIDASRPGEQRTLYVVPMTSTSTNATVRRNEAQLEVVRQIFSENRKDITLTNVGNWISGFNRMTIFDRMVDLTGIGAQVADLFRPGYQLGANGLADSRAVFQDTEKTFRFNPRFVGYDYSPFFTPRFAATRANALANTFYATNVVGTNPAALYRADSFDRTTAPDWGYRDGRIEPTEVWTLTASLIPAANQIWIIVPASAPNESNDFRGNFRSIPAQLTRNVTTEIDLSRLTVAQFVNYMGRISEKYGGHDQLRGLAPVWAKPAGMQFVNFTWETVASPSTAGNSGSVLPGTPIPGTLIPFEIGDTRGPARFIIKATGASGATRVFTFAATPNTPRPARVNAQTLSFVGVNNNQEFIVVNPAEMLDARPPAQRPNVDVRLWSNYNNANQIYQSWTRITGNNYPIPRSVWENDSVTIGTESVRFDAIVFVRTAATATRPPSRPVAITPAEMDKLPTPVDWELDYFASEIERYFTFNVRTGRLGTVRNAQIAPEIRPYGFVQNAKLTVSSNGLHYTRANIDIRPFMLLGLDTDGFLWGNIFVTVPGTRTSPAIRGIELQINLSTGQVKVDQLAAGEVVKFPQDDFESNYNEFAIPAAAQPAMLAPAAVVIPNPKGTEEEDE